MCFATLNSSAQSTVRHQVFADVVQAFLNGLPFEDFSSELGLRYYGAAAEPGAGHPCGCDGLGSDGFLLNLANATAWSNSDPDQASGFTHAFQNEMRFLFRGSGLDLLYASHAFGENLAWEIVDGGSEGNFDTVSSGTFGTFSASPTMQTAQLAAPGSLDEDRLHMLRVWPQESSPSERWISLDAIDVHGSQRFSIEDSLEVRSPTLNPTGTWIPSPEWGDDIDANAIPAIGGGINRSHTDGATMEVLFNGESVAIFGRQLAGTSATFDWQIDGGGPGLEGTIDQTLDSNVAYRWPHVLVNDLSYGEHVLTVTVRNNGETGTAGALGPKPQEDGGYAELDAISVVSFQDLGVRADFNVDQAVNGADFLHWQKGLGITADAIRDDGDANRDGQVTRFDYLVWAFEYGNQAFAGTSAASAHSVPEPSSYALVGLALLSHRLLTRQWTR